MIINGEQRKGRRAVIAALSVCLFIILIFGSLWARTSFSGRQSEEAAVSVASDAAEAISVSATSEKSEGSFTAEPVVSAETAVLIDAASGKVLYDKRKDAHMYPASTTKIMTALIALETMDPEEYTTVSENAVRQEGSSIYLKTDEKIRMKDLLYGMMLRSGNDAAVAVAEAAGGSVEEFAVMMNERASALGLQNSHFVNPSGLQDENHYSSAYDLAMITREAFKSDIFREIVGSKTYQAEREGTDSYKYFYNKNKTVFQYEDATGVKIGYTIAAGRCLVASAKREGTELIAVVLNDHDWFNDAYKLMDYGFDHFETVRIARGEVPLTTAAVMEGDASAVKIGAAEDITCVRTEGETAGLSIVYDIPDAVKAPVKRWELAGKMDIYSEGEYVYSKDLYYLEDVSRAQ
ncbi:MAG: D-alanyl-D-alanine carboxypeptidase family protein [Anaerovoracaceae bacterium]